ncbi:hypothetical protein [Rariglobus hedericola]|uniref:Uncharacterized protein n=1 Tax=Rariglobus hedericola TaxID=2597822 RepID=A0A556QGM0_9BACT|nr:hypothetical protein [Rariglobus hedericola]TSJ75786.1 hypothetical protein FPL22_16100 [Rariglobus hedericola]
MDRLIGRSAPPAPAGVFPSLALDATLPTETSGAETVSLVSIAKPVWAYGVETTPGLLPPKAPAARRIAFTQLATPGLPDLRERLDRPEDDLGRFARGFPLWLAETMYFSVNYTPIAVLGSREQSRHVLFPHPWTPANIQQIVDTAADGLDFVLTGSLTGGDGNQWTLSLQLWDVAKARERKTWSSSFARDNADRALVEFHTHFRLFMEWAAYPEDAGLIYTAPSRPSPWIRTLGISASAFLAEQNALDRAQIDLPSSLIDQVAENAVTGETASLAWLTLAARARRLGLVTELPAVQLLPTPLVKSLSAAGVV